MNNIAEELESNSTDVVEQFKVKAKDQFNATKDPWIMNGFYDYYLQTNSNRVADIIISVKEPHDKHYFDRALEGIKSNNKLQHLTLLGWVVRKRPIWLYKIMQHTLFKEMLRLLKTENDIVIVVSALLILNILIPSTPGYLGKFLPDIFDVFSKLAAMNANSNNYHEAQLVHLQISLYTLFHRLYGMFPRNFVSFLRKEYSSNEKFPVFSHTVKPMLDTVRVNPLIITVSKEWEILPTRWKNVESHDIIVSCAKLLMNGGSQSQYESSHTAYEPNLLFNCKDMLGTLKVSGNQSVADYCKQLSKVTEDVTMWSPSSRFYEAQRHIESTPTMIPLTPVARGFEIGSPYSEHEGSSPPEAAVEATPETTPIREHTKAPAPVLVTASNRSLMLFPSDASTTHGSKVPTSDRSFPSSPIKKESPAFRYSAPEIPPAVVAPLQAFASQRVKKIDRLLSDQIKVTAQENVIELQPVGVSNLRNTNDLNSNFHHQTPAISSNASSAFLQYPASSNALICEEKRESNGIQYTTEDSIRTYNNENHSSDGIIHEVPDCGGSGAAVPDASVDDFEPCEQEKSGSPCSSGGLHMPDNRSLCNFAVHMKHIRERHSSQSNSESGRLSMGNSPKDGLNYFESAKVRRTSSCPEIKKSSPSNTFSLPFEKPRKNQTVHEERDEENDGGAGTITENKLNDVNNIAHTITVESVTTSSATQTDELPPFCFPYEHLFLDLFPPLQKSISGTYLTPVENTNSTAEDRSSSTSVYEKALSPSKLLQKYMDAAGQCHSDKRFMTDITNKGATLKAENKFLTDQLRLLETKLQLEEHRREIHAERNRRLLGRSRRNKTLEEHNNALKNQVILLQKEIENTSDEIVKIVTEKESQIENEHKTAIYWREQYVELQKEHKKITEHCEDSEIELKELKKAYAEEKRILQQTEANVADLMNEMRLYQKEAKIAKDLRTVVADLQREVLIAGEMIVAYRQRLLEYYPQVTGQVQQDMIKESYLEEVERLKRFLNSQTVSLDASREMVRRLKKELTDKENDMEKLKEVMKSAREKQEHEITELKDKYNEVKNLYNYQLGRSNDLDFKLNRAKHVNKITTSVAQPPRTNTLGYTTTVKLSAAHNAISTENNASSSENFVKPPQGISKSPKRFNIHSEIFKLELAKKTDTAAESTTSSSSSQSTLENNGSLSAAGSSASICSGTTTMEPTQVQPLVVSMTSTPSSFEYTKTVKDSFQRSNDQHTEMVAQTSSECMDIFKPIVKKKGRMECAESGQLKPLSITFLDAEPSSSKKPEN